MDWTNLDKFCKKRKLDKFLQLFGKNHFERIFRQNLDFMKKFRLFGQTLDKLGQTLDELGQIETNLGRSGTNFGQSLNKL